MRSHRRPYRAFATAFVALVAVVTVRGRVEASPPDPWIERVKQLVPGDFAGFGQEALPGVVLGPPQGGGALEGSVDVVSLGHGGSITVVFGDNVVFDGPGDDFVVFENAFHSGSETGPIFTEYGIVEVSADRLEWHRFPFDAESGAGLAGGAPVFAAGDNDIDPLSVEAGGDRFDLATLGLSFVRFVRIIDGGDAIDDVGNHVAPADKGGFDLDAVGAIHSSPPGVVRGMVTKDGSPVPRARMKLVPLAGGRKLFRRAKADGTFRFRPVLPSGDYRVVARKAGFGRTTAQTYLDLDQLVVDVELSYSR